MLQSMGLDTTERLSKWLTTLSPNKERTVCPFPHVLSTMSEQSRGRIGVLLLLFNH